MGPCTVNARRPTVDSRCRGTTIICCVADLRRCQPTTSVTGVQPMNLLLLLPVYITSAGYSRVETAGVSRSLPASVTERKLAYYGHRLRKKGNCLENDIIQGTTRPTRPTQPFILLGSINE